VKKNAGCFAAIDVDLSDFEKERTHGNTLSSNLYQKLLPMHVIKTMQFDWSAVFESFWFGKLALNRAAFYLMKVC